MRSNYQVIFNFYPFIRIISFNDYPMLNIVASGFQTLSTIK